MKKQSIATLAEALGKKKGKWEKLAESSDKIKQNTAKYKLNRIDTLFDNLFELQESMKPASKQEGLPMMRRGGNLDWPMGAGGMSAYDNNRNMLPVSGLNSIGSPNRIMGNNFNLNIPTNIPNTFNPARTTHRPTQGEQDYFRNSNRIQDRLGNMVGTEYAEWYLNEEPISNEQAGHQYAIQRGLINRGNIKKVVNESPILNQYTNTSNPYDRSDLDANYRSIIDDALNKEIKSGEEFANKTDRQFIRENNKLDRSLNKQMRQESRAFKGGSKFGQFAKNNIGNIAQGVSILGDFFNQMHHIKQMEEPKQAAFVPRVTLNKNMDTSAYRRQAVEALRTGYKQTKDLPSNVSASVRGNLLSSYLGAAGDINTQANNYRMQMENQEAGMNQQVSTQNAMILNDLYNRQNMFRNQRVAAKSNAWSGLLTKGNMLAKDIHTENFDKKYRLPALTSAYSRDNIDYFNKHNKFPWE